MYSFTLKNVERKEMGAEHQIRAALQSVEVLDVHWLTLVVHMQIGVIKLQSQDMLNRGEQMW